MEETSRWILGVVLGLLFLVLLRFFLLEKWRKIQQKKAMRRGHKLEKAAAKFLRSKGFNVLKSQFEIEYSIWENGNEKLIRITPDYLVEKNGFKYLVEVKSGMQAPKLGYAPTRRQLLEYVVASDVKGVYLLDMEQEQLKKVEFVFDFEKDKTPNVFVWIVVAVVFPIVAIFIDDLWWRYGLISASVLMMLIIKQLLKRR